MRKKVILRDGSPAEQVAALVEHLKKDGHDFTVGIPLDTPIAQAERVVSAGKGIGGKKNMKLIEDLAKAAGAAIGSSRPVAETLKYVPPEPLCGHVRSEVHRQPVHRLRHLRRGAKHLKGIKDASTIVAINTNAGAPIFKKLRLWHRWGCERDSAPADRCSGHRRKAARAAHGEDEAALSPKPEPIGKRYVCGGCGYEYILELGDPDGDIAPGTLFEKLPEDWVCPGVREPKDQFIEA